MVPGPRWTHVALPVREVEQSSAWYRSYTSLVEIDRRQEPDGDAVWLSDPAGRSFPFVLVLVASGASPRPAPGATLAPFAHLGIELPSREGVEAVAERARAEGCLAWEPQQLPAPVGFVCAVRDPDGNLVEFSFDQGVYDCVQQAFPDPSIGVDTASDRAPR